MLTTFTVGGDEFAVDALEVQEVLRHQPMTAVPLAPPEVRGLINLRGQVVVALDLRSRLGLPPLDGGSVPMIVVVRTVEGPVSLLVDAIGDVMQVSDDCFEPAPETLDERRRELVGGVYKLDGGCLLLLLDVEQATAPAAPEPAIP